MVMSGKRKLSDSQHGRPVIPHFRGNLWRKRMHDKPKVSCPKRSSSLQRLQRETSSFVFSPRLAHKSLGNPHQRAPNSLPESCGPLRTAWSVITHLMIVLHLICLPPCLRSTTRPFLRPVNLSTFAALIAKSKSDM